MLRGTFKRITKKLNTNNLTDFESGEKVNDLKTKPAPQQSLFTRPVVK